MVSDADGHDQDETKVYILPIAQKVVILVILLITIQGVRVWGGFECARIELSKEVYDSERP